MLLRGHGYGVPVGNLPTHLHHALRRSFVCCVFVLCLCCVSFVLGGEAALRRLSINEIQVMALCHDLWVVIAGTGVAPQGVISHSFLCVSVISHSFPVCEFDFA